MVAPAITWESISAGGGLAGHGAWLETVAVEHGFKIKRMLYRMLRSEQDVLDVYQDCMYQVLKRARTVVLDNVAGYAFRSAANLALEFIRRRKRRSAHWQRVTAEARLDTLAWDRDSTAAESVQREERRTALRRAIDSLPPHLRDVIVLRDFEQMPYRRVAEIMRIQPTTARVYRRQAIVRMGKFLRP